MAGGISVHAVDVARGRPAQGMQVDIYALEGARKQIASGKLAGSGALDHAVTQGDGVTKGPYEVIFHVGDWYRAQGVPVPTPAFLETVPYRFGVADLAQHYHLPLKMTPWGFSLFRGGA